MVNSVFEGLAKALQTMALPPSDSQFEELLARIEGVAATLEPAAVPHAGLRTAPAACVLGARKTCDRAELATEGSSTVISAPRQLGRFLVRETAIAQASTGWRNPAVNIGNGYLHDTDVCHLVETPDGRLGLCGDCR